MWRARVCLQILSECAPNPQLGREFSRWMEPHASAGPVRYNICEPRPFELRLRDAKVPPKPAGSVPLLVFVALFAVGLGLGGAYVVAADRWCPTTQVVPATPAAPPADLPIRHAISFDRLQAVEQRQPQRWTIRFFCEAKAADLALVFLTYCLAVMAGWLAWATLGLWRTGEQQIGVASVFAETAQKSADTTARALTRLERPYVLPSAVGGITFSEAPDVRHTVGFAVINYGRNSCHSPFRAWPVLDAGGPVHGGPGGQ